MHPLNQPEIMVPFAQQNFDAEGNLTNEKTRELIAQMLQSLVAWSKRLAK
jgi:chromate reductase